jgi:hypothetical protein
MWTAKSEQCSRTTKHTKTRADLQFLADAPASPNGDRTESSLCRFAPCTALGQNHSFPRGFLTAREHKELKESQFYLCALHCCPSESFSFARILDRGLRRFHGLKEIHAGWSLSVSSVKSAVHPFLVAAWPRCVLCGQSPLVAARAALRSFSVFFSCGSCISWFNWILTAKLSVFGTGFRIIEWKRQYTKHR